MALAQYGIPGGTPAPSSSSSSDAASTFSSSVYSTDTSAYGAGESAPTSVPPSAFAPSTSTGADVTGDAAGGLGRFRAPEQSAPAYTLPGFFGQGGQTFVAGEGRLARPRFEATASVSMGYDDNIFQTPSGGEGLRLLNTVLIDPGSPGGEPIIEEREVFLGGGVIGTRPVIVGFTEAQEPIFEEQVTVLPPGERKGSLLTRASFGFQTQIATRRSLFTLDLNAGGTYHWDKKDDPLDRQAGIGANFLYRITPRLQFTASINSAYLTQPDFSRANAPQRDTGDYLSTFSRATLSYRVTPRFSLSVSGSLNSQYFFEEFERIGNYNELILGTEARYLWSPRYTFLVEYRHSMTDYELNTPLNSSTDYLLLGMEMVVNRRLSGSLRVGASMRAFETGGGSSTAPYFETSVSYRTSSRSVLQWTNRFGFEEPGSPTEERLVLRSGLIYSYAFTPRLRGSASIYLLRTTSTFGGDVEEIEQLVFDSHLGLDYTLTEHLSLNCSYSFTNLTSSIPETDYYRNRVFVGAEYRF